MTPIDQTIFTEADVHSNCLEACIATIMDVPLEFVPHLNGKNQPGPHWSAALNEWLAQWDWAYLEVGSLPPSDYKALNINLYHVIVGPSVRDEEFHAVVGRNGRMVHDPHPSRAGLAEGSWYHGLFLKTMLLGSRLQ